MLPLDCCFLVVAQVLNEQTVTFVAVLSKLYGLKFNKKKIENVGKKQCKNLFEHNEVFYMSF